MGGGGVLGWVGVGVAVSEGWLWLQRTKNRER